MSDKRISKKIILVGNVGVGKSSLIRQYVTGIFNNNYITTIGVKIDRKEAVLEGTTVSMIIWDIAGEIRQNQVPKNYYLGSHGVIYVVDLSRPETFENVLPDIDYLKTLIPDAKFQIVGNKKDLYADEEIELIKKNHGLNPDFLTSAKTSENVEDLFTHLATSLL